MKLNYDCLRDVLIALEKHSDISNVISYERFSSFDETKQYQQSEITYSLLKLKEAGFIDSDNRWYDNEPHPMVSDITYSGHEFLNNIRDSNIWSDTKKKANEVSTAISITLLGELAVSLIKQKLGLP